MPHRLRRGFMTIQKKMNMCYKHMKRDVGSSDSFHSFDAEWKGQCYGFTKLFPVVWILQINVFFLTWLRVFVHREIQNSWKLNSLQPTMVGIHRLIMRVAPLIRHQFSSIQPSRFINSKIKHYVYLIAHLMTWPNCDYFYIVIIKLNCIPLIKINQNCYFSLRGRYYIEPKQSKIHNVYSSDQCHSFSKGTRTS